MICPKCRGEGSYFYNGICYPCERCNDTGEVKTITNEEWFCTLPTEVKATFLAIQVRLGVEFYRTNDERYQNHDWWVKWLKQPHREE